MPEPTEQTALSSLPCVVICGGASKRFGGFKGLAKLAGRPLIAHITGALRAQTRGPVAVNCAAASPYSAFGDAVLPDGGPENAGPLAGLLAALDWAENLGAPGVITAPVDTPFLPPDYIAVLSRSGHAATARSADRLHPVCGYWPAALQPELKTALSGGTRALHDWLRQCGAKPADFPNAPPHAFFNINTQADLAQAQALI